MERTGGAGRNKGGHDSVQDGVSDGKHYTEYNPKANSDSQATSADETVIDTNDTMTDSIEKAAVAIGVAVAEAATVMTGSDDFGKAIGSVVDTVTDNTLKRVLTGGMLGGSIGVPGNVADVRVAMDLALGFSMDAIDSLELSREVADATKLSVQIGFGKRRDASNATTNAMDTIAKNSGVVEMGNLARELEVLKETVVSKAKDKFGQVAGEKRRY